MFPVVPVAVGVGVGVPVLIALAVAGWFAFSRRKKSPAVPSRNSVDDLAPGKEMVSTISERASNAQYDLLPPIVAVDYGHGALTTVAPEPEGEYGRGALTTMGPEQF
jgi:hypothetical protein